MRDFIEQLLDGIETAESAELVDQGTVCGLRVSKVRECSGPSEGLQCLGRRFLLQYEMRNMVVGWAKGRRRRR